MKYQRLLKRTINGLILAALLLQGCGAPVPIKRTGAVCAVVEGKAYVIGGLNIKGKSSSIVEEYDLSANRWISKTSMPTSRAMTSAVTVDGKIYVLGGRNENGITNAVEVYDPISNSWEEVTTMPQARWNHMVAEVKGKIYVIGGIVGTGKSRRSIGTVEIYDPIENSWKSGNSLRTPRQGAAITVVQEKIYVIGGRIGAGSRGTATSIVEVYDPLKDLWSSVEPLPERRTMARAVAMDGKIYVIGGAYEGNIIGSIDMYDPDTDTWVMMVLSLQEPRTGHCVASLGDTIYVFGGATEESLAGIVGTVEELIVR